MHISEGRTGDREQAGSLTALIGSLLVGLTIATFSAGVLADEWKDAGAAQQSSRTAPSMVVEAVQFPTMADAAVATMAMSTADDDGPQFPAMADAAFAQR